MHRLKQRSLSLMLALGLFLGSCRGYVALFETDSAEPLKVYPYRITTLPPKDQQALEQGIPIRSEKELHHLLEDYLS